MFKRVLLEGSDGLIREFDNSSNSYFKFRRHCKKYGGSRGDVMSTGKYTIAEIDPFSLGWAQAVYGPLPGRRPDFIAIIEYTGIYQGTMVVPVHYDGTPYIVECYDNVNDNEYCMWMDLVGMSYEEAVEQIKSGNIISLCREY